LVDVIEECTKSCMVVGGDKDSKPRDMGEEMKYERGGRFKKLEEWTTVVSLTIFFMELETKSMVEAELSLGFGSCSISSPRYILTSSLSISFASSSSDNGKTFTTHW
jgi:hypothetical protein